MKTNKLLHWNDYFVKMKRLEDAGGDPVPGTSRMLSEHSILPCELLPQLWSYSGNINFEKLYQQFFADIYVHLWFQSFTKPVAFTVGLLALYTLCLDSGVDTSKFPWLRCISDAFRCRYEFLKIIWTLISVYKCKFQLSGIFQVVTLSIWRHLFRRIYRNVKIECA